MLILMLTILIMKIKSLWISKYKNIENLNLHLESQHHISLLLGQNGVGKSNLIEILILVFKCLKEIESIEDFLNWPTLENYFEFEIGYELFGKEIKIQCYEDLFNVYLKVDEEFSQVNFEDFINHRNDQFLPKNILIYYSGQNKRITNIISDSNKNESDWLSYYFGVLNHEEEEKVSNIPSGHLQFLFHIQNLHSKFLLFTLSMFQNSKRFGQKIDNLLKEYLQIEFIDEFEICFKSPIEYTESFIPTENDRTIDYLISNILNEKSNPFWGLQEDMDKLIFLFYNHIAKRGKIPISYPESIEDEFDTQESVYKEYIVFDEIDFNSFHKNQLEGTSPIDFFNSLNKANIIDVLHDITFKVKREGVKDLIQISDLSEGEQQLLSVIGLLLLTDDFENLYLLDEPDTHLNPNWQRDYVEILNDFTENNTESQIIVATHSPLIVQSSKESEVILFSKDDNNNVVAEISEIEFHRWRTDHVLTSKYFALENARPKSKKMEKFMKKREEILSKDVLTVEDENFLTEFIDEGGLLPSGETYKDLIAMQYIRRTARKFKKNDPSK